MQQNYARWNGKIEITGRHPSTKTQQWINNATPVVFMLTCFSLALLILDL